MDRAEERFSALESSVASLSVVSKELQSITNELQKNAKLSIQTMSKMTKKVDLINDMHKMLKTLLANQGFKKTKKIKKIKRHQEEESELLIKKEGINLLPKQENKRPTQAESLQLDTGVKESIQDSNLKEAIEITASQRFQPIIENELGVKGAVKEEKVEELGVEEQDLETVFEEKKMMEEKRGGAEIAHCFQNSDSANTSAEELQKDLLTVRQKSQQSKLSLISVEIEEDSYAHIKHGRKDIFMPKKFLKSGTTGSVYHCSNKNFRLQRAGIYRIQLCLHHHQSHLMQAYTWMPGVFNS